MESALIALSGQTQVLGAGSNCVSVLHMLALWMQSAVRPARWSVEPLTRPECSGRGENKSGCSVKGTSSKHVGLERKAIFNLVLYLKPDLSLLAIFRTVLGE